jgi:hypothetical protein
MYPDENFSLFYYMYFYYMYPLEKKKKKQFCFFLHVFLLTKKDFSVFLVLGFDESESVCGVTFRRGKKVS